MIADEIERDTSLVFRRVEEFFKIGQVRLECKGKTHELGVWRDLADCRHDGIVDLIVIRLLDVMLDINFVQDFPVFDFVAVSRVMIYTTFIRKTTLHVPRNQTRIVIADFFQRWVTKLSSLIVIKVGVVDIIWVSVRGTIWEDPHPAWRGTEVDDV